MKKQIRFITIFLILQVATLSLTACQSNVNNPSKEKQQEQQDDQQSLNETTVAESNENNSQKNESTIDETDKQIGTETDGINNTDTTKSANPITLENVKQLDQEGSYSCEYNNIERNFILYIPENVKENAPLLFMLHGYGDKVESFMNDTDMNTTAEEYGYAVVYPQGIPDPNDNTSASGWNSGLKDSGNDDTGFLVSLANYLQETYNFRKDATFAAGFSNGAFMMYRLATQAPDTFRAVASVSGFMTEGAWNERPEKSTISILQINGTDDNVIPTDEQAKKGYKNPAPTIETAIQYWKDIENLNDYKEVKLSDNSTAHYYSDASSPNIICHIVIDGGHHSWPEEQFCGFNTNKTVLEFFDNFTK